MMKKYEFFYSPQLSGVKPDIEIVEFNDDVTDQDVQEAFQEWVFDKLDTGYREIRDEEAD
ncbi:hypothetical protein CEB3_c13390 [Peptococcaceae bacterium CEB3]|nr:hypothetical protein CEB3_c13390 [Peptococcaceae bacterium CEB3]